MKGKWLALEIFIHASGRRLNFNIHKITNNNKKIKIICAQLKKGKMWLVVFGGGFDPKLANIEQNRIKDHQGLKRSEDGGVLVCTVWERLATKIHQTTIPDPPGLNITSVLREHQIFVQRL